MPCGRHGAQLLGQDCRVLHGLGRTLGLVGQHRVAGVAEQRDPAVDPDRIGPPVVQREAGDVVLGFGQHGRDAVVPAVVGFDELPCRGGGGPLLGHLVGARHAADDIEVLAATDEVVHQVTARPVPDGALEAIEEEPGRRVGPQQLPGDQGTEGHVAGEDQGVLGAHQIADLGTDTVRADEGVGGVPRAVLRDRHGTSRIASVEGGDAAVGTDGDGGARTGRIRAGVEDHPVQICPVVVPVRRVEGVLDVPSERSEADDAAVLPAAAHLVEGLGADGFQLLYAGPDPAECGWRSARSGSRLPPRPAEEPVRGR